MNHLEAAITTGLASVCFDKDQIWYLFFYLPQIHVTVMDDRNQLI